MAFFYSSCFKFPAFKVFPASNITLHFAVCQNQIVFCFGFLNIALHLGVLKNSLLVKWHPLPQ